MTVTVYEKNEPNADKPVWRVTTMRDGIVNNEDFECDDATPSSRARALEKANRYARDERKKETRDGRS